MNAYDGAGGPAVIVPVKRLEGAKSRLGPALDAAARRALVLAMLEDVLAAVRAGHAGMLLVLSADPACDALAGRYGARRVADAAQGYNAAVAAALRQREVAAATAALVLPADLPQLRAADVRALIAALAGTDVVLAASADGGTTALGLRPPTAMSPAFGPGSAAAHRRRARDAGLRLVEPPLADMAVDVDSLDDLRAVADRAGAATAALLARLALAAPGTP